MWNDNGKSEDFELNSKQIAQLLKLANISNNDTFYDLGSATGRVIIQLAKQGNFKKAIGIESEKKHFQKARDLMFSLLKLNQIKKIDFWLGKFGEEDYGCFDFEIKDANVIYNSLNEEADEIKFYTKKIKKKRIKILKKDLPLVGYKSIANRSNKDCWFFRHTYPLIKIKKNDWILSVLGKQGTIEDVYKYYKNQIKKREISKKEITDSILDLKKLVNKRF